MRMRSTLDSIMTQDLVLPISYVISKVDAHWFYYFNKSNKNAG